MTITLEVTPLKATVLYQQLLRRKGFTSKKFDMIGTVPPWKVVQVEAFTAGEDYVLAVYPASHEIDFALFKDMLDYPNLWRILDHEYEILESIDKDIPIYADLALNREKRLLLWTDNTSHSLAITYNDFKCLVHPNEGVFSLPLL